jgi:hypothetical protein
MRKEIEAIIQSPRKEEPRIRSTHCQILTRKKFLEERNQRSVKLFKHGGS